MRRASGAMMNRHRDVGEGKPEDPRDAFAGTLACTLTKRRPGAQIQETAMEKAPKASTATISSGREGKANPECAYRAFARPPDG